MRGDVSVCQATKIEPAQTEIKPKLTPVTKPTSLNPEEKQLVLFQHLSWVKLLANCVARHLPPSVSVDELTGAGNEGLLKAIDKFDPSRNNQFKTYAHFRVMGSILTELRNMDWASRTVRKKRREIQQTTIIVERELNRPANDLDIAKQLGVSLNDYYSTLKKVQKIQFLSLEEHPCFDKDGEDVFEPIQLIIAQEGKEIIAKVVKSLPEQEQKVLSLCYYEGLKLKEIAGIMSLTGSRISQIHAKAIERLRKRLRRYFKKT